jgi:iron complex transport system permease protein
VLALGEAEALHLGVPVARLQRRIVVLVALAVGTAVAFTGAIGFVGLVVPHVGRALFGPDHRLLIPAAALLGPSLLLLADAFARTIAAPAELPIGIVTAMLGAPVFLGLLARQRGREAP